MTLPATPAAPTKRACTPQSAAMAMLETAMATAMATGETGAERAGVRGRPTRPTVRAAKHAAPAAVWHMHAPWLWDELCSVHYNAIIAPHCITAPALLYSA